MNEAYAATTGIIRSGSPEAWSREIFRVVDVQPVRRKDRRSIARDLKIPRPGAWKAREAAPSPILCTFIGGTIGHEVQRRLQSDEGGAEVTGRRNAPATARSGGGGDRQHHGGEGIPAVATVRDGPYIIGKTYATTQVSPSFRIASRSPSPKVSRATASWSCARSS